MRVAGILEALSAILFGAAVAASIAGPLRFELFGAALSVRTLSRPLIAATILLAARAWLTTAQDRRSEVIMISARTALATMAAAGVIGWLTFLSTTVGGADSYGYVSASQRLLAGDLVQPEPLAMVLPIPDPISAATPLGYTPSVLVPNATVPIYPLGLPALMAGATLVAGHDGPFLVAPALGLVLLLGTWCAAWALCRDRFVALTAVTLTAIHPVVFTYSIQPMSDVPAAALFMIALAAIVAERRRPVLAGCAAALSLLIRPALAPALLSLAILPSIQARRVDVRSAIQFIASWMLGLALHLWSQWHLYGHPLASGYEPMQTLFSFSRIGTNASSHGYWAWLTLGPIFISAAAVGIAVTTSVTRRVAALITGTVVIPYLAYRTFDHWETLRFLLPALVVLTIPAAEGLVAVGRRALGAKAGAMVVVALVVALASGWLAWLRVNQVFTMPEHEARHRLAGELVRQATPENAVILAQQHHGSIRFYAHRQSIGWDRIPAGSMPAVVAALRAIGHPVYLLLDDALERRLFETRHGSVADWAPNGQRRSVQLLEAPRGTDTPP